MAHAKERNLKQAPISEAVIDLQVKTRSDFASYVPALRTAFKGSFDTVGEQVAEQIGRRGLIFPETPNDEAVQVSEMGFSFSKLRPYTSWEHVRDSARRFWAIYRSVVDVEIVNRIGVRYINQFRLSSDQRVADRLTAPPPVPETDEPLEVTSTLSRLLIQDRKLAISARVFYVCSVDDSGTLVTIDVDAFKPGEFDPETDQMWQTLEELRRMKNRIFFGSITETAAREFDK